MTVSLLAVLSALVVAPRAVADTDAPPEDEIVHTYITESGACEQRSESWSDHWTGATHDIRYAADGDPLYQLATKRSLREDGSWAQTTREISHADRAYRELTLTMGRHRWPTNEDVAGELRDQQATGVLVAQGHERVRDRDALVLSGHGPYDTRRWWVDPRTYEPLKMTTTLPGGEGVHTELYEKLPRTPENLATLWPSIPEGYEEVRMGQPFPVQGAGCLRGAVPNPPAQSARSHCRALRRGARARHGAPARRKPCAQHKHHRKDVKPRPRSGR